MRITEPAVRKPPPLPGRSPAGGPWQQVVPLQSLGSRPDTANVGIVAAHLGELTAAGVRVPAGFVVAAMPVSVTAPPRLTDGLADAIRSAYFELGGAVTIRTDEVAGTHVAGEDAVVATIGRQRSASGGAAVIVHAMVLAEFTGVAFTADPVASRTRRVLIETGRPDHSRLRARRVTLRVARLVRDIERRVHGPMRLAWADAGGWTFVLDARPAGA